MAFEDIGYTIFAEVLGMAQYPGSPFTGEIVKDLILFLLVPSVFIILFVYRILGSLFANTQGKLRLLVGITLYLFIVASGYYAAFALIAGPYFIVLIFVLGILYFVFGHFGVRRGHTMPGAALAHDGTGFAGKLDLRHRHDTNKEIEELKKEMERAEKRRAQLIDKPGMDRAIQAENDRIAAAEKEIRKLERELEFT